ncbi:MAG: NAD(P)-binding domain-containing protein [Pseudomonadota bacterium]
MSQTNNIHTIVIGGGQAGLCASYYLSQQSIDHVVLERARIGERWRSERWDSLHFQFPNRYLRLPGFPYTGSAPDDFMHREGVIDVIERYATHIQAPVQCGVDVQRLEQTTSGGFILHTNSGRFGADNVILATGPYQHTKRPSVSAALPRRLRQLPASAYSNAATLPAGGVMVVGAGGSGVQIAEDLLAAGRDTWLCVGNFKRMPRRYRGREIMDWFEDLKLIDAMPLNPDPHDHAPLLTGVNGGYEVDLRRLVAAGATLLGRLEGTNPENNEQVQLGDRLLEHMANAETAYQTVIANLEAAFAARGIEPAEPPGQPPAPGPLPPTPPTELNLEAADINSIIWATGYGVDFSWVDCGDYHGDGMPVQERGVSTTPGLYFLGLFYLHNARSSFFWGVGDDAKHVVDHIAQRT